MVAVLVIVSAGLFAPNTKSEAPEESRSEKKTILNAVMIPVDDAPEGTYIIEYSNGNKEILHPDGTRAVLTHEHK